jgi:GDP-D-mannose dehydratase
MQREIGVMPKIIVCNVENFTAKKPDDYVIATGKQYSVKEFVNLTAKKLEYENKMERQRNKRKSLQ